MNTLYQTIPSQDLLQQSGFFLKTLTLSQYRCLPKIIPNSVLKYKLKNKQISRPNPKRIYTYEQQIKLLF